MILRVFLGPEVGLISSIKIFQSIFYILSHSQDIFSRGAAVKDALQPKKQGISSNYTVDPDLEVSVEVWKVLEHLLLDLFYISSNNNNNNNNIDYNTENDTNKISLSTLRLVLTSGLAMILIDLLYQLLYILKDHKLVNNDIDIYMKIIINYTSSILLILTNLISTCTWYHSIDLSFKDSIDAFIWYLYSTNIISLLVEQIASISQGQVLTNPSYCGLMKNIMSFFCSLSVFVRYINLYYIY